MLIGHEERSENALELVPQTGWDWRQDATRQGISPVENAGVVPDPVTPTININASLGNLVVFHDSFYQAHLHSFLSQHFRSTMSIWTLDFDYDLVSREKPEVVLQECAERFVNFIKPQ